MTTAQIIERAADLIGTRGYGFLRYGDDSHTGSMCEVGALRHAIAGVHYDTAAHAAELQEVLSALHPGEDIHVAWTPQFQWDHWGRGLDAQQRLVRHMRATAARLADQPEPATTPDKAKVTA